MITFFSFPFMTLSHMVNILNSLNKAYNIFDYLMVVTQTFRDSEDCI